MAISELQMGLIGAGGVVVVGIFAFNKWQERKQRRELEALNNVQPLGEDSSARPAAARVEPVIAGEAAPRPQPSHQEVKNASARRVPPPLPAEVDERADWVVRIEAIEPVVAGRLLQSAHHYLEGVSKPVRWYGFSDTDNRWDQLNANSADSYHWVCAVLQLVDRRGAATEAELAQFGAGLQQMCDLFVAIPSLPSTAEALAKAAEIDRFCAGVDIQIGVNVVAAQQGFSGTKLRGLAEAAGLELLGDGCFHARDEAGVSQFMLSNIEPTLFAAEEMRTVVTSGVTLTLDVPRVANGARAFERMMGFAQQLAQTLGGSVVDDNRTPLGDKAAALIREQVEQFQAQMAEQGIPAGSPLALRLFS